LTFVRWTSVVDLLDFRLVRRQRVAVPPAVDIDDLAVGLGMEDLYAELRPG